MSDENRVIRLRDRPSRMRKTQVFLDCYKSLRVILKPCIDFVFFELDALGFEMQNDAQVTKDSISRIPSSIESFVSRLATLRDVDPRFNRRADATDALISKLRVLQSTASELISLFERPRYSPNDLQNDISQAEVQAARKEELVEKLVQETAIILTSAFALFRSVDQDESDFK